MQGVQQAINYEEVAAYVAKGGAELYAFPSGGTQTGGFVVSWDLDNGFSGYGWDSKNEVSPAYGYTEDAIFEDAQDGNLNTMFSNWASRVPFEYRLNWVTDWMNTKGCVSEA